MNKMALLIPVFLSLSLIEWLLTRKRKTGLFAKENTAMNICIGAIDQITSLANFFLFMLFLSYIYDNFRLFTLEKTWYHWVLAYIAVDFVSYWYHRFAHRISILWCGHVTHHSSSYFNLSNGFRTSPFQGLNRIVFWGILPLLGFSPEVLFITFIISGLYDFFLHTQNFPKLRWLEKVLITPSLHSVHHGKNDIYIDKNYGSTFVFWDKWFGTFQDETEPVVYGILSKEYKDDDPVNAIFYHYIYLAKMMVRTRSWKNRIKLLVMPPDWVPEDLREVPDLAISPIQVPRLSQTIYGISQFVLGALGVLAILVFRDFIHPSFFVVAAVVFLSSMIVAVRVFNHSTGATFRRNEWFRVALLLLLVSTRFFFEPTSYIWVLIVYLFVTLTTTLFLPSPEIGTEHPAESL